MDSENATINLAQTEAWTSNLKLASRVR